MKKQYVPYLRCLIGSHKYFEGSMSPALAKHQQNLGGLSVIEAIESIASYTDTYQEVCCLYLAVAFIKRFPKANARLAFSPEENPLLKKPNRRAAKVCLLLDGSIADLVSMVGERDRREFEELLGKHCDITISEYCKKNLLAGEELTVLPSIKGHEDESFLTFFFQNKEAEHYSL